MSSGGPAVINPRSEQTRLTPDAHRQVLTDIDERDARNSKSGSAAAEAVRLRKVRPMMFCPVDARTAILLTAAAADRSWRRRRRSGWRWRSGGGRRRRMPGRLSWPRRARVRVRMSGRTLLSAGCGRCSGGPKRWCVVGLRGHRVPCPLCRNLPRLSPRNRCRIAHSFEGETLGGF